jgi:cyclic-di-GMP-binding protein
MPSFDVVSKTDLAEVGNAIDGVTRELTTRFDFKGSNSKIERQEGNLTLTAEDGTKLRQMQELVKGYFVRRKLDPRCIEWKDEEKASGNTLRQVAIVKQGIDREIAKQIITAIKEAKLKVQGSIQGDELRVTGKKRDDLQDAIALIKTLKIELPLQFVNFRD